MTHHCDVQVKFLSRRALLASSKVDGAALSLFALVPQKLEPGLPLRLHILLGDCDQRFTLTGKVSFSAPQGATGNRGIAVVFEGDEKRAAAQMLAFCAGRPLTLGTANAERFPVRVKCKMTLPNRRVTGVISDLSNTGAFFASPYLSHARVGGPVMLELQPSWLPFRSQRIWAIVVWKGEKNGINGCAVRFTGEVSKTRAQVKKLLSPVS